MVIGIDASRAFLKNRTGIEEYSYQTIKHLIKKLENNQVVLYLRKNQKVDFALPTNWKIKIINWSYFWTQAGLSLEMLLHPVDVLFVPAHTVPLIHPKNTVVTIHGLEYEFCPQAYSFWERVYMRCTIKKSCQWASRIIAASENTKKDLIKLYEVLAEKISVIYEGYETNHVIASEDESRPSGTNRSAAIPEQQSTNQNSTLDELSSGIATVASLPRNDINFPYLLFIGRLEERKNIIGIIDAFETLKENYKIPHKLVLAGKPGFGYEKIQDYLSDSSYKSDVILAGFVSEEEKWELLKNAAVFVFPTLYEGFGIPVLEAQSVGCPVVASNNSSIIEVVSENFQFPISNFESNFNEQISNLKNSKLKIDSKFKIQNSALLVDPHNAEAIAEAIHNLISNETLKNDIIQKGYANVKRFSWDKCAKEIAEILCNQKN